MRWSGGLAVALSGCVAILGAHGPDSVDPPKPDKCTREWTAPIADLVILGVLTTVIVATATRSTEGENPGKAISGTVVPILFIAPWALAELVSAPIGFYKVARCHDAYAAMPQPVEKPPP